MTGGPFSCHSKTLRGRFESMEMSIGRRHDLEHSSSRTTESFVWASERSDHDCYNAQRRDKNDE